MARTKTDSATMNNDLAWLRLAPAVLLPSFLFSVVQGVTAPMIPVIAEDLGASLATAGLISALVLVGQLVGNLPSGALVDRIGERKGMLLACVVSAAGLLLALAAVSPAMLAAAVFVMGLANATFGIARQALITQIVPAAYRGRGMSVMVGSARAGLLLGPFAGALGVWLTGDPGSVFIVGLIALALGAAAVFALPDPETMVGTAAGAVRAAARPSLFGTVWSNRAMLLRVGPAVMAVTGMRQARIILVPLWGVALGMDPVDLSLLVGLSGIFDTALFYTGGALMDRFGRTWVAVPTLISFAACWLALAASERTSIAVQLFVVITVVSAIINGASSGIAATLGSDLADPLSPGAFLGAWRLTTDLGSAGIPLVIAAVTAALSLAAAAAATGLIAAAGAGLMYRYLPRYLPEELHWRRPVKEVAHEPA